MSGKIVFHRLHKVEFQSDNEDTKKNQNKNNFFRANVDEKVLPNSGFRNHKLHFV